jgi:hypothetical protein
MARRVPWVIWRFVVPQLDLCKTVLQGGTKLNMGQSQFQQSVQNPWMDLVLTGGDSLPHACQGIGWRIGIWMPLGGFSSQIIHSLVSFDTAIVQSTRG